MTFALRIAALVFAATISLAVPAAAQQRSGNTYGPDELVGAGHRFFGSVSRGLASVIFALIAYDELGAASGPLVSIVSWTVLLSVLAHGLSAAPLVERYTATE